MVYSDAVNQLMKKKMYTMLLIFLEEIMNR